MYFLALVATSNRLKPKIFTKSLFFYLNRKTILYRFIKIIVRLNLLFIDGISHLFVGLSSINVEEEQIILKESCMGSKKNKKSLEVLIVKNNRIRKYTLC